MAKDGSRPRPACRAPEQPGYPPAPEMPVDSLDGNDEILNSSNLTHGNGVHVPEPDQPSFPQPNGSEHRDAARPLAREDGYGALVNGLEEEIRAVRQRVAARLLPALKAEMQRRPHQTYGDKKELAVWVNAELRRLGLAIRFPGSDREATLVADLGRNREEGRFELRSESDEGKIKKFNSINLSKIIQHIELIPARPRREAFAADAEWRAQVGRRGGASRG